MQQSLMPKGVEHTPSPSTVKVAPGVQQSLMPKGVEHCGVGLARFVTSSVQQSLMPKGVEHRFEPRARIKVRLCSNL